VCRASGQKEQTATLSFRVKTIAQENRFSLNHQSIVIPLGGPGGAFVEKAEDFEHYLSAGYKLFSSAMKCLSSKSIMAAKRV